ncbi:hypothetical protein BpHYR1_006612 [Brachionus plicatilis]|uniref:Uncharacterized protein n=1 Tax=Brachionus plicatilis TaxID=10195 RepID=A0A3M7QMR8_BRAPC|nr:hypothetical protein BpHYR1_006612 [Brachionus plicatilis]
MKKHVFFVYKSLNLSNRIKLHFYVNGSKKRFGSPFEYFISCFQKENIILSLGLLTENLEI